MNNRVLWRQSTLDDEKKKKSEKVVSSEHIEK